MADKTNRKARTTQRLVNYFPLWADTRIDEQSAGFQFFNAIGGMFDDLLREQQTAEAGLHLVTTPINRLDLGTATQLPDDFVFQPRDDDPASEDYYPPVVSGEINNVCYAVTLTADNKSHNEIDTYIAEPPTRISRDAFYLNYQWLVASGYVSDSPLITLPFSGELLPASELYVTMRSGEPYLYVDDSNKLHQTLIQVVGTSRYGYEQTEELRFPYGEKQVTLNEYDVVSGVYAFGAQTPGEAYIQVQSMDFNSPPYPDAYYLDYDKDTDLDIPGFWTLGENSAGYSTLDFTVYDHADVLVRLAGYTGTHAVFSQELKDLNGNAIIARDLAVQPHSNHIWVVSYSKLYCYSSELPYVNLQSLADITPDRACRIETDEDFVLEDNTITLEFIWRNPTKGLKRHRVSAIHENGTKYVLDGNSLIAFDPADEYWQYGEPLSRHLRAPVELTLTVSGRYTFILEATLGDDTVEIDRRVIQNRPLLLPLAEFSFPDINITNNIVGIHIDRGNEIWVLTEENHIFKILRHTDTMLIDYEKKIIYCKELYDKLYVFPNQYTED